MPRRGSETKRTGDFYNGIRSLRESDLSCYTSKRKSLPSDDPSGSDSQSHDPNRVLPFTSEPPPPFCRESRLNRWTTLHPTPPDPDPGSPDPIRSPRATGTDTQPRDTTLRRTKGSSLHPNHIVPSPYLHCTGSSDTLLPSPSLTFRFTGESQGDPSHTLD